MTANWVGAILVLMNVNSDIQKVAVRIKLKNVNILFYVIIYYVEQKISRRIPVASS